MPSYDYICNNEECQVDTFAVLKTGFEDTWEHCPKCNVKSKERKKFYQFSFTI